MLRNLAGRIVTLLASANPSSSITACGSCYARTLSVSTVRHDLMEFFDEPKQWGEKEIKVGRSWKTDELRLKSNVDLHKLWYILLKEKNMLLTMEHDASTMNKVFANPERIDKVEESMKNLEEVVRERNVAYFTLEAGTTGERTGEEFENWMGLQEYRQHEEFPVPKEQNKEWYIKQQNEPHSMATDKEKWYYFSRLREKQRREARREQRSQLAYIQETVKNFPDVDLEYLKELSPAVSQELFDRTLERVKDRDWENNSIPWRVKKWRGQPLNIAKPSWKNKYGGAH